MGTRPAMVIVVATVLAVAATVWAAPQGTAAQSQPQPSQRAQAQSEVRSQPASSASVSSASADAIVRSMGISLDRIRRQLRESPPTIGPSVLKLQYHIEVVAKAPPIELLKGFNIDKASAVPYGGMTHAEFLNIVAPPWRKWQR